MNLDRLRMFAVVAEARSFTAAAAELGLPKSTVSREIARLEAEMGVRLLHRTTRKVVPSTAGAELLLRVSPLLGSLQEAICDIREHQDEPSGLLRVTTTNDIGVAVLSRLVARYTQRYPAVRVEAVLTNRVVDLAEERIDLALRVTSGQLEDSSLVARQLGPMSLELFASPRYLARRGKPQRPEDLAEHDQVGFLGIAGNADGARIAGDDMFFVREVLRADGGIGLLPSFVAEADVASGELVRVFPRLSRRTGTVWLVYPSSAHLPRTVTAFRDLAVETLDRESLFHDGDPAR